jgi:hypothetical protein
MIMCLRSWLRWPGATKEEKYEYNRLMLEEDLHSSVGDDESVLLAHYISRAPGQAADELEL